MDPASAAIGVVSGAAGLVALAISTTSYLLGLKDSYKTVEIVVLDLVTTCQALETAWRRIHDWASAQQLQSTTADSIFGELLAYHENSKIVLGALHSDLEHADGASRSPGSSWRFGSRTKVRFVLHEKGLKDHGERLNHQISSLNLLLSTAQLTSPKVQEVVLDILKPIFRKDEDSAWTVANSRIPDSKASTRARPSVRHPGASMITESRFNDAAVPDNKAFEYKRFDFENDLIIGPVYKRVLFAQLCAAPTLRTKLDGDSSSTMHVASTENAGTGPRRGDLQTEPASGAVFSDEDWSPENIVRILQARGGFSIGVTADLAELRETPENSSLPKRSLPLGSILKQNSLVSAGQAFVNAKLIFGATVDDVDQVAQALDEGAEINAVSEEGHTALKISLANSWTSTTAALLLLYHETKMHHRDGDGDTILHWAVKEGEVLLIRRLVTGIDDLRVFDSNGATPLHVAARAGATGLAALKELNRLFAGQEVCADVAVDHAGRSALVVAVDKGNTQHTIKLLRMGSDPAFISKPGSSYQSPGSPLYHAVAAGNIAMVGAILEECSEMIDLVNWRHHLRHSLLDSVKDSQMMQRYEMAELLICKGADWRQTWGQSDRVLEFASTGATPKLLLTLMSQGCFPTQRDIDITSALPTLQDPNNKDLAAAAAAALFFYRMLRSEPHRLAARPFTFYARLGATSDSGSSAFTERLTYEEILESILVPNDKSPTQTEESVSLIHRKEPTDVVIPAKFALRPLALANLGQAYYHMDRYSLGDARKKEHEARLKRLALNIFSQGKTEKVLAPS
ncbi:hypothetical protein LTR67_008535 [Exophiala xenobiotica]